jgi:hypothetical protein
MSDQLLLVQINSFHRDLVPFDLGLGGAKVAVQLADALQQGQENVVGRHLFEAFSTFRSLWTCRSSLFCAVCS